MNAFWRQQAKRIDRLSLRERVIMFLSVALALVAIADAFVFTPLAAEQRQLGQRIESQNRELEALRTSLAAATQPAAADSPQSRLQRELAAVRTQREGIDAAIGRQRATQDGASSIAVVVERVLRRHDKLSLVRLAVMPARPLAGGGKLVIQGVELSVAGPYADLVTYLAELERTMPALRWGDLHLAAGTPPTLTVQLLTLGDLP